VLPVGVEREGARDTVCGERAKPRPEGGTLAGVHRVAAHVGACCRGASSGVVVRAVVDHDHARTVGARTGDHGSDGIGRPERGHHGGDVGPRPGQEARASEPRAGSTASHSRSPTRM